MQGFFALHDTKTPVIVASLSMALNIGLNMALAGPMGYRGLALATSLSFGANFLGLYVLLCRRHGPLFTAAFGVGLLKILVACGCMGGAVVGTQAGVGALLHGGSSLHEAAHVLLPVLVGLLVYPGACAMLRLEDANLLWRLLSRFRAA